VKGNRHCNGNGNGLNRQGAKAQSGRSGEEREHFAYPLRLRAFAVQLSNRPLG